MVTNTLQATSRVHLLNKMCPPFLGFTIFLLLFGGVNEARAQQWFTPEVAKEVGQEPCDGCSIGRRQYTIKAGRGRITAATMFYFDTVANQAQGRIVDATSGKPIKGAVIQLEYSCRESCDSKVASANEAGFFRLGWIGCNGPVDDSKIGRKNYPLLVQADGYQTMTTQNADFSSSTYLHIELIPVGQKLKLR